MRNSFLVEDDRQALQMQRLSVVLHTAVAWQTVNELACGESGIVHGAECIAVLNAESLRRLRW